MTILEGYGATETGPVLALNDLEDQRIGTVGRLLPGIEHRLEPWPGWMVTGCWCGAKRDGRLPAA